MMIMSLSVVKAFHNLFMPALGRPFPWGENLPFGEFLLFMYFSPQYSALHSGWRLLWGAHGGCGALCHSIPNKDRVSPCGVSCIFVIVLEEPK